MAQKSAIEWTESTWNPVTGCTKVSPGCQHCYAERISELFRGVSGHPYEMGFDLTLRPGRLVQPLKWKRPKRIFVNSMSDLFHEDLPDEFIDKVFGVMALCPQHTFQVLTKRPNRMREWMEKERKRVAVVECLAELYVGHPELAERWPFDVQRAGLRGWPLPNVWLGVSVEDQKRADERIPLLLDTPAAVRFVSAEPLLGPVSNLRTKNLDWVIVGGESGPGARPMNPEWVRSIRDRCQSSGVPFFFKQWGGRTPKAGGNVLDGRQWLEYPESGIKPESGGFSDK